MTDKEVGELWRRASNDELVTPQYDLSIYADYCLDLIRKLVAERTRWYKESRKVNPEIQACLDFGIDPDMEREGE